MFMFSCHWQSYCSSPQHLPYEMAFHLSPLWNIISISIRKVLSCRTRGCLCKISPICSVLCHAPPRVLYFTASPFPLPLSSVFLRHSDGLENLPYLLSTSFHIHTSICSLRTGFSFFPNTSITTHQCTSSVSLILSKLGLTPPAVIHEAVTRRCNLSFLKVRYILMMTDTQLISNRNFVML